MRSAFFTSLLCAGLLAGCSVRIVESENSVTGGAFNPGLWRTLNARVSPDVQSNRDAPVAALPPEAGRLVQVRARRYANGLRQEIVHAADAAARGENLVEVTMRHEPEGERYENLVTLPGATDADIRAELDQRFPGVKMEIQSYVLRNAYGPYGLAAGRQAGGANCVYLWQTIDDLAEPMRARHITIQPTETALRVRLCKQGASLRQLAQIASVVTIDPSGDPIAMPVGAAPLAGGADALTAAADEAPTPRAGATRFAGYRLPPGRDRLAPPSETRFAAAPAPRKKLARRARPAAVAQDETPAYRPVYGGAAPAGYPAGHPGFAVPATPSAPITAPAPATTGASLALPPQALRGPGRAAPR